MVPSAAGFKLTSDRGFKYYNQTSQNSNFEIDTSGNLDLKSNDINNAGAITTEQVLSGSVDTDRLSHDNVHNVAEYADGEGTDANPYVNWTDITDQLPTTTWRAVGVDVTGPYGELYFPEGVYECDGWTIPEPSNVTLRGESQYPEVIETSDDDALAHGSSLIRSTSADGNAIVLPQGTDSNTIIFSMFDMAVKQLSTNMTANEGWVLDMDGWFVGEIDRVFLAGIDTGNGYLPARLWNCETGFKTNTKEVGYLRGSNATEYGAMVDAPHINVEHLAVHGITNSNSDAIGVFWNKYAESNLTTAQVLQCNKAMECNGSEFFTKLVFESCDSSMTVTSFRDNPTIGRLKLGGGTPFDDGLSAGWAEILAGESRTHENREATFSGDGTQTKFRVLEHKLPANPSNRSKVFVQTMPVSNDAISAGIKQAYPVDDDGDGNYEALEIEFESAPASGTDNVEVKWTSELLGTAE
jgi:hypothetical protein